MGTPPKTVVPIIASPTRRVTINRRAFLRGAGTVAIGLPFLEGLPERSAWAADSPPVFSMFIVAACGVVGNKFFPSATGPLTTAGLMAMPDKAVSVLAPHAPNLLFIKGINFPLTGPTGCGHAQGLCQSLTAAPPAGNGGSAYSTGVSADMVIAPAVNAGAADPLTLYAGSKAYIAERISFKAGGAGQVRAADLNPYNLYTKLTGLTTTTGAGGGTTVDPVAMELVTTRKSVNDLVRAELNSLMGMSALSSADKQRLKQHFDGIRDTEITMGTMAASCTKDGLSTTQLDALRTGFAFKANGMIEDVVKLHLELVALAFACNFNRVATLQWGDGTDGTKYSVPSNASLGWPFHHLSHRVDSDASVGSNPTAEQAHAEIDVLRMQSLLHGLDAFQARGLQDKSFVMWTNHIADGPSHSMRNVPHIIWGNGGGYLKQGLYLDAGNVTNNKLFNTLITAAIRDKSSAPVSFGMGTGTGTIAGMLA
ncbi:MAG TPA: DUF1552 domain-containing protein [Polyangia bacterium]|nr:DUF1552 domain-containing protein [Polyangia bacterium]